MENTAVNYNELTVQDAIDMWILLERPPYEPKVITNSKINWDEVEENEEENR